MKLRKVILILEVKTEAPLSVLRMASKYGNIFLSVPLGYQVAEVLQAQANVVVPAKKGRT